MDQFGCHLDSQTAASCATSLAAALRRITGQKALIAASNPEVAHWLQPDTVIYLRKDGTVLVLRNTRDKALSRPNVAWKLPEQQTKEKDQDQDQDQDQESREEESSLERRKSPADCSLYKGVEEFFGCEGGLYPGLQVTRREMGESLTVTLNLTLTLTLTLTL